MRPIRKAFLGNGRLALGFDAGLRLREMFWPKIGQSNHVQEGRECGLMLWMPGKLRRIGGDGWDASGGYGPGMSFSWELAMRDGDIRATVTDCVDPYLPVWARTVEVAGSDAGNMLGLYSVQAYALGENTTGEAAAWDEKAGRLYHFKGRCWVAIKLGGAEDSGSRDKARAAVAKVRDGGVRVRSEDGGLEGQTVDHGLIESAIGLLWRAAGTVHAEYLLALGKDRAEADRNLDAALDARSVRDRSQRFWDRAPPALRVPALIVASHSDEGGGILAACDTDIQGDYRDHYRYVWPRDAAMCAGAMLRAGLPDYAMRYIRFCCKAVEDRGFLWQRYRPDGSRGSGWHPWNLPDGDLPVQEDETALSLILAGDYLALTGDLRCINDAYRPFVRRAASFIASYTLDDGRLVRPSFDLWEERRGTFSFTQACCVGALRAAADIASALGQNGDSRRFLSSALLLLQGLVEALSTDELGFCRSPGDWTCDSSLFLIPLVLTKTGSVGPECAFLLAEATRRARATWRRLRSSLAVALPGARAPGFARYTGDWYFRPGGAGDLPGNVWAVTTAWYVRSGLELGELGHDDLTLYLGWFDDLAGQGGHLPEQFDCVTGRALSVSPLAWSHAMHLELLSLSRRGNTPGNERAE